MNEELLGECPEGDLLQQIDDLIGPGIERAVQRWLPRDIARGVRGRAVRFLGEEIRPKPTVPIVEEPISQTSEVKGFLRWLGEERTSNSLQSSCRG